MYRGNRITIAIPCFNEEHGLPGVLSAKPDFVDEVVVVDNGSTDRSAEVARRLGARVVREDRRGYGRASLAGLRNASGDIVVTLDADGNLFMSDVRPVLDYLLDSGLDFVNGNRFPLSDKRLMPLSCRLSNHLISWMIRRLFGMPVADTQCGFLAVRAAVIPRLALSAPGMEFSQEVKIKAWADPGIKAGECHVGYGKRAGTRKFKAVLDSFKIIRHALALRRAGVGRQAPAAVPRSRSFLGPFLVAALVALATAAGFHRDARLARYTDLTTDQLNILTVCTCRDYPAALGQDMVAGHPDSRNYYIPSFVDLVRCLAGPDHDYVKGLGRLQAATIVIFMCGWWLLFTLWVSPWAAIPAAFLVRAVAPLPGGETWGVGGLWTVLPRALFLAVLPWILWLWLRHGKRRTVWCAVCLLLGLLAGVHPLSGVAVLAGVLTADTGVGLVERKRGWAVAARVGLGAVAALAGGLPLIAHLAAAGGGARVGVAELSRALPLRVPADVLFPGVYLRQWLHPSLLAFVLLPPMLLFLVFRDALRQHRLHVCALLLFAAGSAAVSVLLRAAQYLLQEMGHPVFFATYMMRGVKFVVVSAGLLWLLLLGSLGRRAIVRGGAGRLAVAAAPLLLIAGLLGVRLLPVMSSASLRAGPVRFFWPEWVGPRLPPVNAGQNDDMENALTWIRENTPESARFVGPMILRVAARRSVIHDHKGASFLFENNPPAFLAWAGRQRRLLECEQYSPDRLPELYRSWGADYWVVTQNVERLSAVYRDGNWGVYDLRNMGR